MTGRLPRDLEQCVAAALREDLGSGDLTALLVPQREATARIVTRENAVLCGRPYAEAVFRTLDPSVRSRVGM